MSIITQAWEMHQFEVWSQDTVRERPATIKVASFQYFQEALDFLEYCNKRGASVILRTTYDGSKWTAKRYPAEQPLVREKVKGWVQRRVNSMLAGGVK
jgi:hypothetical protein